MENRGVEVVVKMKVDSEVAVWLEKHKAFRDKGNVTSRAVEFYYDYHFNRKGFFIRLIDLHFEEIKYLLRKIGRIKKNCN